MIAYPVGIVLILLAWRIAGGVLLAGHFSECNLKVPMADAEHTAMASAKGLMACVDERAGVVEWLAFRPMKKLFASLPNTPCSYRGAWEARRTGSTYQVTLLDSGQFVALPVRTAEPGAPWVKGSWSAAGSPEHPLLVWLYDEGRVFPPDINRVTNQRPGAFTLIEEDGSTTDYTRIGDAPGAQGCGSPEPG